MVVVVVEGWCREMVWWTFFLMEKEMGEGFRDGKEGFDG